MLHQHLISIQHLSATYEKKSSSSHLCNSNTDTTLHPTHTSGDINSFQASSSHHVQSNLARSSSEVLLETAVIKAQHKGKFYIARALFQVDGDNNTYWNACDSSRR